MTKKEKTLQDLIFGDELSEALTEAQNKKNENEETERPFSNGTEFNLFQCMNCFKCRFYDEDINKTCTIEHDITLSAMTDGQVLKKTLSNLSKKDGWYSKCKLRKPII